MPENTAAVNRPTRYGNPFIVNPRVKPGSRSGAFFICVPTIEDAVESYRLYMLEQPDLLARARWELRGKNLACYCKISEPCHADVLLELVNS